MTIFALRGWRSGLLAAAAGRADRGRELLRERERERVRLRLSRVPLAGAEPLLRDRECEASRGVTERACDLDRASSGVGERPREGLRLSDMVVQLTGGVEVLFQVVLSVCDEFVNNSWVNWCAVSSDVSCLGWRLLLVNFGRAPVYL